MSKDEVYQAPAGDAAPPVRPVDSPLEVGLDPMAVPRAVWADLSAHPVGYFLSGAGYFVAVLALVTFCLAALGLGMAPGIVMEDDTVLAIGGLIGGGIYTVGILTFSFIGFPMMNASMLRALEEQRAGHSTLGVGSLFRSARDGAGRVVVFHLVSQALALVGFLCCYLPGFVVAAVALFAMPIVVFEEDVGPLEAMRKGFDHMRAEPMFHLATWILMFCALIALELTIVGLMVLFPLIAAWQLYAYRAAFVDNAPEAA